MRRLRIFAAHFCSRAALAAVIVAGLAAVSSAQTAPPRAAGPMYNTATEVTIKGTVEAVRQVSGARNWAGTHLTLKTGTETIDVHVGPSWYLTQNKINFDKGETIEVTGSKVKYQDREAVIAREIAKGGKTITLRNARGIPVWARGRGMSPPSR